jgi:hypothetical protein
VRGVSLSVRQARALSAAWHGFSRSEPKWQSLAINGVRALSRLNSEHTFWSAWIYSWSRSRSTFCLEVAKKTMWLSWERTTLWYTFKYLSRVFINKGNGKAHISYVSACNSERRPNAIKNICYWTVRADVFNLHKLLLGHFHGNDPFKQTSFTFWRAKFMDFKETELLQLCCFADQSYKFYGEYFSNIAIIMAT